MYAYLLLFQNTAGWVANRVDPDQMPHFASSDLDLHCLLSHSVSVHKDNAYIYEKVPFLH